MITVNTLLFGVLAGLITFKIVLLAVAALLLVYGLSEQTRRRSAASAKVGIKPGKLDVHA